MRIISFFDWIKFPIQDILHRVKCDLANQFKEPFVGILTCDEKTYSSSNIETLVEKFEGYSGSVSLEIYTGVVDETDPERGWQSYFNYSLRLKGKKSCIVAINNTLLIKKIEVIKFIENISHVGSVGYGFSFDYDGNSDGRYYSQGISTEKSSDIQREEDARWFNERINLKGLHHKHNRHLKGYFKDVFEINIINKHHLANIKKILGDVDGMLDLSSDNFLWIPNANDFNYIRKSLRQHKLII